MSSEPSGPLLRLPDSSSGAYSSVCAVRLVGKGPSLLGQTLQCMCLALCVMFGGHLPWLALTACGCYRRELS